MNGSSESAASNSLEGLVQSIQKILERAKGMGMSLEGAISVFNRTHLQIEFDNMKLKTKDKRSNFFDDMNRLLADKGNEWFAFFHVHT